MTNTLVIGWNALYHDTAIILIDVPGRRVFGMSTERITRYKHDGIPPIPVLKELVQTLGIHAQTIQKVVIATTLRSQRHARVDRFMYESEIALREFLEARYVREVVSRKEQLQRQNLFKQCIDLVRSSAGRRYLLHRIYGRLRRTTVPKAITSDISPYFPKATIEVAPFDHHLAHAYGAFVLAGLPDALVVTLDGWGDGCFSKAFVRDGATLKQVSASFSVSVQNTESRRSLRGQVPAHMLGTGIFDELSLGHFYSIITWLLGFEPVSDEGKVEALAAYGQPDNDFRLELERAIVLDSEHARFVVNRDAAVGLFHNIEKLQNYVDRLGREAIAATMQHFLEERVLSLVTLLLRRFPRSSVVLSGGCAANVILNMHIFERVCSNIFVPPAMADDGAALGSCLLALQERGVTQSDISFLYQSTLPYYGSQSSRKDVQHALVSAREEIVFLDQSDDWPEIAATLLADGQIGAVYQGCMEWGPRALGNRSILANPCLAETRERLNKVIKQRPLFQPFCPAVLIEEKERLFERAYDNRHMTCAFRMRGEFQQQLPAAIHVDGTARVQFVHQNDNPHLYRVLAHFKRLSGFGVVINTSFNVHGRTIVNTPEDAIDDFLASHMNFLILEGYLVRRRRQPKADDHIDQHGSQSECDGKATVCALSGR